MIRFLDGALAMKNLFAVVLCLTSLVFLDFNVVATPVHGDVPPPVDISNKEVKQILRKAGYSRVKIIEVDFEVDETIKVVTGPFRGYNGLIVEINPDRGKLKALISIFGRETPVELEFDHVEKVSGG